MDNGERSKDFPAFVCEHDTDLTPIGHAAGPADKTELRQPVHMFAHTMRFEQKLFGESADQHFATRRTDREKSLMLLWSDARSRCSLLAEMQKLPQLMSDARERLIVLVTQIVDHATVLARSARWRT